jgi:hypothetical protein
MHAYTAAGVSAHTIFSVDKSSHVHRLNATEWSNVLLRAACWHASTCGTHILFPCKTHYKGGELGMYPTYVVLCMHMSCMCVYVYVYIRTCKPHLTNVMNSVVIIRTSCRTCTCHVCVHTHTHTHTLTHTYIYIYIYIYMRVFVYVYMLIVCSQVHTHNINTCISQVYTHSESAPWSDLYTYIHTYTYTYTYIYIYINTPV